VNSIESSPVILIGFGRSGTSIISDIVLNHPSLGVISNYNAIFPSTPSVGLLRYFFENRFYKLTGQKKQLNKTSMFNKYIFKNAEAYAYLNNVTGVNFGKLFLNDIILDDKEVERMQKEFNRLIKYQGKSRLGFKTTGPSRLAYLHQLFPKACFINIVRDPLPNINSLLNVHFYQDRKHDLWWEGNDVYSQDEKRFVKENKNKPHLIAALQYYKVHEYHRKEIEQCSIQDQVLSVRYENFISAPKEEIERIYDFTGLTMNQGTIDFLKKNQIVNRNKNSFSAFDRSQHDIIKDIALRGIQL
tara:strand:+ start:92496 stop:93398 length:903 start_codon:yes stop_codon:yes gene_type:complete